MTPDYSTRRIEVAPGVALALDLFAPAGEVRPPGFLLVHGLASNARLYDGVAARLAAAGHGAASVDLRGHGRSDKPESGYDFDTICADVAAVLVALADDPGGEQFDRPVVVGQSYGGNLVLELAARRPDLLRGVACIDGGTIELGERFATFEEVRAVLSPPQLVGTPYDELARRFAAMHADWPPDAVAASLANFEVREDGTIAPHLTLDHHLEILRSMWEERTGELYGAVEVPVLLLPAESPGSPPAWAVAKREGVERAAATLRRSQVHWFSPADHDVHAQHPDAVAKVLLEAGDGLFA